MSSQELQEGGSSGEPLLLLGRGEAGHGRRSERAVRKG
jgi:hypothetical protein